ncbi:hypothetical protein [uncultured Spirosoma sp.]|uniref:hypothetical protein n=1 Tax=uncultured Spirosoma sp. TaxID=278208 RepID=UPI002586577F|nr:hypothetical protein [uncultured Spirosoma sp.]
MATTSPFDPDKIDSEFYSRDPNQHGSSDYGHESAGVSASIADPDQATISQPNAATPDSNSGDVTGAPDYGSSTGNAVSSTGSVISQEWDVPETVKPRSEGHMMSDEAAEKLGSVAENPSDDALLHRADATYLEQGDNPNEGYDPHHKGYDGKDKEEVQ